MNLLSQTSNRSERALRGYLIGKRILFAVLMVCFSGVFTSLQEPAVVDTEYNLQEEVDKALTNALVYLEKNSFKINDQQEIIWATLINEAYDLNLNIPARITLTENRPDSKFWQHKLYDTYFNPDLEVLNDKMISKFRRNPELVFEKQPESTRIYSLYCGELSFGRTEFLAALKSELDKGMYPELNIVDPIMMLQNVISSGCLIDTGAEEKKLLQELLKPLADKFDNDLFLSREPSETKQNFFSLCVLLYTGNCVELSPMVVPYLTNMQLENGGFPGSTGETVDSYYQSLLGTWALLELKKRLDCIDKIESEEEQELASQINAKVYYSYQEFDELQGVGVNPQLDSLLQELGITEKQYRDSINNIPKGQIFEEGSYRPAW